MQGLDCNVVHISLQIIVFDIFLYKFDNTVKGPLIKIASFTFILLNILVVGSTCLTIHNANVYCDPSVL